MQAAKTQDQAPAGPSWSERYEAYWNEEGRFWAAERLKLTCTFILVCQVAFVGLDLWAFPEHFVAFFWMRLLVDAYVLAVLLRLRFTHPGGSQIGVGLLVALEILVMVYASRESASLYYAGLLLVLAGMPVLQSIRVKDSLLICAVCVGGYALCPLFVEGELDSRAFAISMLFVASAAFESVVSCQLLSGARLTSFEQRREIEAARDELASLDEAKTRFSANVHHELRTPLTLMLAPLEMLRGGDFGELGDSVLRTLRTMHVNGQRLHKLINNLLDLAKLESKQFEVHRLSLDIGDVIGEVVEGATPMAERKEIALRLETADDCPVVHADQDAIEKVVVNLLGNALKFTPEGGSITVSLAPDDGGLRVRVKDSGIGLDAGQLARIFDRFAQVDASATRKHEGTGIGLSLAQELVGLHGGKIWAESPGPGEGATMNVWLPIGESDGAEEEEVVRDDSGKALSLDASIELLEAEREREEAAGTEGDSLVELERSVERWESLHGRGVDPVAAAGPEARPRVVVADDNRDMRELLNFLLGRDYRVSLARNGREALELAHQVEPDLVVSDIMMPEMSGTELCAALKRDAATAHIPVMLVSSKAESEMKIEGLELGADDYITKPFHPRELQVRARGLVGMHVLQRAIAERNAELEQALADLKQAEGQLVQSERLAAVGELAAGIAHEVNNPVNFSLNAARAMHTAVGELKEVADAITAVDWQDPSANGADLVALRTKLESAGIEELAGTVGELSDIVAEGLHRTARLVGDLRDFASTKKRERRGFDLCESIESTVGLLRPTLSPEGVNLEVTLPQAPCIVEGDAGAVNQVFLNLIKNAAEAFEGPAGIVSVQLTTERAAGEASPIAVVRIADDGPGIPEDVLARLFEPFFTTKAAGRGSGLGLSICRRIADEHEGQLEVESTVGVGSCFTLSLPLAEAAEGDDEVAG